MNKEIIKQKLEMSKHELEKAIKQREDYKMYHKAKTLESIQLYDTINNLINQISMHISTLEEIKNTWRTNK